MDGFLGIPAQLLSALTGTQNTTPAQQVNAQIPNSSAPILQALLASQQNGATLLATVLRENRDGSLTLQTPKGELKIFFFTQDKNVTSPHLQNQTSGTQTQTAVPADGASRFYAGDTIRLDIPYAQTKGTAEPVAVRVSLEQAGSLHQSATSARTSETPIQVQMGAATLKTLGSQSLNATLKPMTEQAQTWLNTQGNEGKPNLNQFVKLNIQNIDLSYKNNFDTNRSVNIDTATRHLPDAPQRLSFLPDLSTASRGQSITQMPSMPTSNGSSVALPTPPSQSGMLSASSQAIGSMNVPSTPSPAVNTNYNFENSQLSRFTSAQFHSIPSHPPQGDAQRSQALTGNAGTVYARVVGVMPDRTAIVSLQTAQPFSQPPLGMGSFWPQESYIPMGDKLYTLTLPQGYDAQILKAGSTFIMSALPSQATQSTGMPMSNGALLEAPSFLNAAPWPVMTEIMQALQAQDAQAAQALQNLIPNITTVQNAVNVVPAAMLFLSVARGGDLQGWLGNKAIELLRSSGKGDLLTRLGHDMQTLGRVLNEPLQHEWRVNSFPFLDQGGVNTAALYYKHEDQEQKNGKTERQTRFIFDMRLDHMGKVQVDGLYRPQKLDLILRTRAPLSPAMRTHMRGLYHDSLENSGLKGDLSFQSDPKQYFHVSPKNSGFAEEL